MAGKTYYKIKNTICPSCQSPNMEFLIKGVCFRKGRVEKPGEVISFKCADCGVLRKLDIEKQGFKQRSLKIKNLIQ